MYLYKKYNWMYLLFLMISCFFVIYMNNYYSIWLMMEFNLLIFLTLMILNDYYVNEKIMKYFLLNSFSSMIFLFFYNLSMFNMNYLFLNIMNLMILLKLGMFPFHFWFIDLMMSMNWFMCFLLSSIQKFIPMYLLNNFISSVMIYFFSILGGLFIIMFIFNQIILKKLFAYSSIIHMSWMLIILLISIKIWFFYYFSYMMINYILMKILYIYNFNDLNDLIKNSNFNFKYILIFFLLSLGGLPPFYGFLMKWLGIYSMIYYNINFYLILLMILYSLIFLYYYIRLIFNYLIYYCMEFNINYMNIMKLDLNYLFNFFMIFFLFNLFFLFFWIFY